MSERRHFLREFLATSAAFCMTASCAPEKLFGPERPRVTKTFFGHMIQGDWIGDDGELLYPETHPVSVFFGLLRYWDSRAVWWKLEQDWSGLEANLAYAERVGADSLFVFGAPPASACIPDSNVPTPQAWENFVRAVIAKSAGRILIWELWNEANEPDFWDATPQLLAEYSRVAYEIIKATQPDAIVLSPSLTSLGVEYCATFADRFFAAGGAKWCDAIAFHAYTTKPEMIYGDLGALRSLMHEYRIAKPIWNTEFGIAVPDPALRSAYMAQSLLIQAAAGVECAVWNPETEDAVADYTDDTMRRVADLILGAEVGPIARDGSGRRCALTYSDGSTRQLAWTEPSFPSLVDPK